MAKRKNEPQAVPADFFGEMKSKGIEHKIPGTGRLVRLRTLDASELLREGKIPDILTPLVVKSVYQDLTDKEVRDFLGQNRGKVDDALTMMDTMNFVVGKAIADNTKVADLTLGEKRWIFRLAMGPAEILVSFRYDPNADVEPVAEGEDVPQTAE